MSHSSPLHISSLLSAMLRVCNLTQLVPLHMSSWPYTSWLLAATRTNESCHILLPYTYAPLCTYARVISHFLSLYIWMGHVTFFTSTYMHIYIFHLHIYLTTSTYIYFSPPHIFFTSTYILMRMSHVTLFASTYVNESCHNLKEWKRVKRPIHVCTAKESLTWHIYMSRGKERHMTHSHV